MKINFFYISLLIIALYSCTKENQGVLPGAFKIVPFDVTMSVPEAKVGEPVSFRFQGNADTVYFWSGEFGKDYNYIDGRETTIENPTLKIATNSNYGNQLSLYIMLSQDFNGDYSYEGITAATWKDMTAKFNIATPTGSSTEFTSDPVDITQFFEGGQPYYIAVRNNIQASSPGNLPTQWIFRGTASHGYSFKGLINGTSVDILPTFADAEWKIAVDGYLGGELDGTRGPRLSPNLSPTPTSITFTRNNPSAAAMDAWAVTKPLSSKVSLGGDRGTLIKRISDLPLQEYKYIYTAPGEYDVTFEGINQDGTQRVVQLKITVAP